ncbi:hypothetical protein ACFQ88_33245 [Paenibacillus sp. NPDC056579]|uniref:hypothetical protein n=1 Tax=unclassified Paenibacillus TaxID=185978 RepID=UPI001EF773B5|nr:hypothetical protein [Paenibacillus sp. H1-7]
MENERSQSNETGEQVQNEGAVSASAAAAQEAGDALHQGRQDYFMDIDRMVNEGLGGGIVSLNNGLIEESTTDTMDHPESVLEP